MVMDLLKKVNDYIVHQMPALNRVVGPAKFYTARFVVARAIKQRIRSLIVPHYKRTAAVENDQNAKKAIVIGTFIHEYYRYLLTESSIALLLREQGVQSTIVYNGNRDFYRQWMDETEPHHVQYNWAVTEKVDRFLKRHLPKLYRSFSSFSLPSSEEVDELARTMIKENSFELLGHDLLYHVTISISRFYRSAPKMIEFEPDYQRVLFGQTCNAIRSLLLAEQIVKECKPDLVVMSHSLYAFWGPMHDYFKASGTRTIIVHPRDGFITNSIYFHARNLERSEYESIYAHVDTKPEYKKIVSDTVDDILEERFSLRSRDIAEVAMIRADQDKEAAFISRLVDLKQQGIAIYGMFPNLLYDYPYSTRKGAFPYITDWITDVVQYFENQSDKKLILKLHPVEQNPRVRPRANPLLVLEKILGLKEEDLKNVMVIKPKDNITSYSLFPYLTAGLLYSGTLGIEMLYKHIPIINGTIEAAYTRIGLTVDAKNKKEFYHNLNHPNEVLAFQEANYNKILAAILIYLKVNQMPVSFVTDASKAMSDTTLNRVVDFLVDSGEKSYIDHIFHPFLLDAITKTASGEHI